MYGEQRAAGDQDEADLAAAATPLIARIAGGASLLAGVITALTSVQTLTWVRIRGAMAAAPYVMIVVGLAACIVGLQVMRSRAWAAVAATGLAGLMLLLTGGWLVYSISRGLLSLFALADPFLWVLALGLSIVSIDRCARVTAARKRLAERGLDAGI